MIASEYLIPQGTDLKVVATEEVAMHAIAGQEKISDVLLQSEKKSSPVAEAFTITFSYNNEQHSTRVLKAGDGNYAFYKVIISSRLHEHAGVYWLQHQPKGWTVLLGQTLDEQLIQAIANAIASR